MSATPSLPAPDAELPGDFVGPTLAQAPDRWVIELDGATRRALDALARATPDEHFERRVADAMHEVTATCRDRLTHGPGVVLVRGVPVEGHAPAAVAALFTAIGRGLGDPQAQNLDGEGITEVRDTGADPQDPEVRLYRTRAAQGPHTDGADLIGLLCLRAAAQGGHSRIVSSVRVFKTIAARRPDLAPLLLQPWYFHLPGGAARGLPEAMPRPIVRYDGRTLQSFFIGWYLRNAQGRPGVPLLDAARRELLALYETTAEDPALVLEMDLRPGDLQWLRNAFVLHGRTAYDDPPPPAPGRHLLRLWLAAPDFDDTTPRFDDAGGVA
jgi:hypothetical protein